MDCNCTISEAKIAKREMEKEIATALNKFEIRTGLKPGPIHPYRHAEKRPGMAECFRYDVTISVKIE
jgi:hypothetical protein